MIEFEGVEKTYLSLRGRPVRAVDDFSLEVRAGEVMGIAGPNGAGKSTLIAMLLGCLRPTAGTIRIAGLPPRPYIERYGVGYPSLAWVLGYGAACTVAALAVIRHRAFA